jgi:hypothetical protein
MKVEIISEDKNECFICKDTQGFFFEVRLDDRSRWQYIFGKPDEVTDDMVAEAVRSWRLKKDLTSKALNTFSNLIDEL